MDYGDLRRFCSVPFQQLCELSAQTRDAIDGGAKGMSFTSFFGAFAIYEVLDDDENKTSNDDSSFCEQRHLVDDAFVRAIRDRSRAMDDEG